MFFIQFYWTIFERKSSCKNLSDDYNATPSLKANDCQ